jgi:hypothetical protein
MYIQHTKTEKKYQMAIKYMYQMATKYTKWLQNTQNGFEIYEMDIKYTKALQNLHTSIGIFVCKYTYHLAILVWLFRIYQNVRSFII